MSKAVVLHTSTVRRGQLCVRWDDLQSIQKSSACAPNPILHRGMPHPGEAINRVNGLHNDNQHRTAVASSPSEKAADAKTAREPAM